MVAFVRTGLINNIEQPELVEYSVRSENILGEGGCGRVYAGRFRGNNVAIKVIGKGLVVMSCIRLSESQANVKLKRETSLG